MNSSIERWIVGHVELAKQNMANVRLLDSWSSTGSVLRKEQRDIVQIFCGLETLQSLLLYWDTGTGKTFTTVAIMHCLHQRDPRWRFLVLVPASLQNVWERGLKKAWRADPGMRDHVRLVRYNNDKPGISFSVQYNKIVDPKRSKVCIIIDEVHNFISRSMPKADGAPRDKLYDEIVKLSSELNNRLILLSATPIRNSTREFSYLLHLLRPSVINVGERVLDANSELHDREGLKMRIYGTVSSNSVSSENDLFEKFERTDHFAERNTFMVPMTMSKRQSEIYDNIEYSENRLNGNMFKVYRRMYSAVAADFGTGISGEVVARNRARIESLKFRDNVDFSKVDPGKPIMSNEHDQNVIDLLMGYSVKFTHACIQMRTLPGKFLIYQFFVNNYGIEFFISFLKVFNISYMEFTSRVPTEKRTLRLNMFNDPNNDNGDVIKVCVFSDSGNEGVNYKSVRNLIIIDLPWSYADLVQIIGRGHRSDSHSNLPEKDRVLDVFVYIATSISGNSVDREMIGIIERKKKANNKILKCMKESSFESLIERYASEHVKQVESEFVFDTLRRPSKDANKKVIVMNNIENQETVDIMYRLTYSKTIKRGELAGNGMVYDDGMSVGRVVKNEKGAIVVEPGPNGPVYIVKFEPDNTFLK